jgi:3-hydroxybutyryl-CoA dehydratase
MKFADLQLEQEGVGVIVVTDDLINAYAELTQDFNLIHTDDAAAIKAGFSGKIAHGLICQAEVSRILGTVFPGEGTILLQEDFKFVGAVYMGDKIVTKVWVTELIPEKQRVRLDFECLNQHARPVLTGNALVKLIN